MTIDHFITQFQSALSPEAVKLLNWAKSKASQEEIEGFEDWANEIGGDGPKVFSNQQPNDFFPSCKLSWDDVKKL